MSRTLVVSKHAAAYQEVLRAAGIDAACHSATAAARTGVAEAEILFGAPDLLAPLLPACTNLRWVQSSWAGVKPLLDCPRRDYLLTGVRDIFGAPMREFVLGWLLALERRVPERTAARSWDNSVDGAIAGKTIGIMGTGSIGAAVAQACRRLGLTTRGLNTDGRPVDGFDRCWPTTARHRFAAGLDYLLAVLPETPATDNVVDGPLLDALRPGAIFINAGRGNAVVLEALLAALERGQLRHAVLDVLRDEPLPDDSQLWRVRGLSITSHTAAPTPERAIAELFCENYRRFEAGAPLRYPIDFLRGY